MVIGKEVYEIDFDGQLKATVEVKNNRIEILKAINGYGTLIPLNKVKVTTQEQK